MYVNAHVLNQSREDPALRSALEEADLVYCDGYGVRLAAKALSAEIPHRMTGADWIWDLATLCERATRSVYLLGCEPGVARQAGRACAARTRSCASSARTTATSRSARARRARHRGHQPLQARHPARRHGNAEAGDLGAAHRRPPGLLGAVERRAPCSTSSPDAYRAPRPPWRTMAWNGSSDWRSSRSGCGGATWWATRCSCSRVVAQARQRHEPLSPRLAPRACRGSALVGAAVARARAGAVRGRPGRGGIAGAPHVGVAIGVLFGVSASAPTRLLLPAGCAATRRSGSCPSAPSARRSSSRCWPTPSYRSTSRWRSCSPAASRSRLRLAARPRPAARALAREPDAGLVADARRATVSRC